MLNSLWCPGCHVWYLLIRLENSLFTYTSNSRLFRLSGRKRICFRSWQNTGFKQYNKQKLSKKRILKRTSINFEESYQLQLKLILLHDLVDSFHCKWYVFHSVLPKFISLSITQWRCLIHLSLVPKTKNFLHCFVMFTILSDNKSVQITELRWVSSLHFKVE